MRCHILVIRKDGEQEYLREGSAIAVFSSSARAVEMRDFMMEGMADEVQSINVVPAEKKTRGRFRWWSS